MTIVSRCVPSHRVARNIPGGRGRGCSRHGWGGRRRAGEGRAGGVVGGGRL